MTKLNTSSEVEKYLGIALPEDYKSFIDNIGYLCLDNIGIEIYGHKPGFSMDKLPSVVAATQLYRNDYKLNETMIVISHTGFEDYIVVLNAETGHVLEMNSMGDYEEISDSFFGWLQKIREQNEKEGEKPGSDSNGAS